MMFKFIDDQSKISPWWKRPLAAARAVVLRRCDASGCCGKPVPPGTAPYPWWREMPPPVAGRLTGGGVGCVSRAK